MKYQLTRKDRLIAVRIVTIYALASGLWIYLSDNLLAILIPDQKIFVMYSVYKGFLFIAATVYLLYHLIASYIQKSRQAEEALKRLNEDLETRVVARTEELEKSRLELERQNKELQETYHGLEMETAKRIRAMEELRNNERLMIQQSRMAAMGEMLGNIAHHWRQPLNVLGLKVQQLGLAYESGGFSKELLAANISEVMSIVLHLSQTIDAFRNFCGPDKLKSLFSVNQVVRKTIALIAESFAEQGISIDVETVADAQINGYPNEYVQMLLNILMNSRDAFLAQQTSAGRITVRSWAENGKSVVTIADNAGGIKEEIMAKIFDAYFTTRDSGKGTGVGLFMAKTIVEKNMGGRLTMRNVANGAEFRIEV